MRVLSPAATWRAIISPAIIILILCAVHVFSTGTNLDTEPSSSSASAQIWGPYRPNLYFGVRPQAPKTMLMSLMWGNGENQSSLLHSLRDTCDKDNGIDRFGWTMYDPRSGGFQTIHDKDNWVDIDTEFIRLDDAETWGVRVRGAPRKDAPRDMKTAVIFHMALEDMEGQGMRYKPDKMVKCRPGDEHVEDMLAICEGSEPALGSFQIRVFGNSTNRVAGPAFMGVKVKEDQIWQAKSAFAKKIRGRKDTKRKLAVVLDDEDDEDPNMRFLQLVFEGAFKIDYIYSSFSAISALTPDGVTSRMDKTRSSFAQRVDSVFPQTAPFHGPEYAECAQSLLSNLLGGLGFFYGDSMVDSARHDETAPEFWKAKPKHSSGKATTPKSLLSFTPSRTSFTHGSLWDEGFHLLPVIEWDLDLAIAVIQSWLGQMDGDGWIAREQILGPEARSRVAKDFHTQYPHIANPPTLLLLLPLLVDKLTRTSPYHGHPSTYLASEEKGLELLEELYAKFNRHYNWLRRTQAGNLTNLSYPRPAGAVLGEGYRWRGRTPGHSLPSGLDDYPRPEPPHPGELHVDALSWVAASSKALLQVAQHLGEKEDATIYARQLAGALHNLDVLHWDDTGKAYCDATVNKDGAYERLCHIGYVSLMPLFLGLMSPDHPNLPALLKHLSDPEELWSDYGLRSLSRTDEFYGKDEDDWRGAIWVNMNVLAVLRLHDLGMKEGPQQARARTLANGLRKHLVKNVYDNWVRTGTVWEKYDDKTGHGKGSSGFTGWSACVLLLLGMKDDGHHAHADGTTTIRPSSGGEAGIEGWDGESITNAMTETGLEWSSTGRMLVLASFLIFLLAVLRKRQLMGLLSRFLGARRTRKLPQ
ncbi:mannosyl-oligosaccharide glucosidase [Diplogelasinospora grovesii]|uniref:Mannosyl-oligosaccharide glucosidase n=1 Tax=Diplogelasinospora grovesii TaxID=303347 RepID=A0AAN6N5Q9_9PEZI|nr:mannosyl-oligosaccharide glucosidase [Diplogelasinospora grovesii]